MTTGSNNTASSGQGANTQAGTGQGAQGAGTGGGQSSGYGPGQFGGAPFGGGHMFDPMQMMMIMAAMQGARQGPQQAMPGPSACFSPMTPGAWTGFPWAWMIWWAWWWSWLVWPGFLPGGGAMPAMPGAPNLMNQFAFTRADFWFHLFEAMKAIWQQAANSTGFANFAPAGDAKPTERTDPAKLREALREFPDEQRERIVWAVQCSEMMMSMFQFPRR